MKKIMNQILGLLLVTILCWNCGNSVEKVDFTLNGEPIWNIDVQNDVDTTKSFKIFVGDSIVFLDASLPEGVTKTNVWTLTKDSAIVNVASNSNPLTKGFDQSGFYQMQFCVNGTDDCVMKLILVQAREAPAEQPAIVEAAPSPIYLPPAPNPKPAMPKSGGGGGGKSAPAPAIVSNTPVYTPPAPIEKPAPVVQPSKPASFNKINTISASSAARASKDCIDQSTTFSVTLKPSKEVQLSSFKLFSDGCGSLKITLKGGDIDDQTTVGLTNGKTQVSLSGLDDTKLDAGQTYVLSGTTVAGGSGCSDTKQPHLEDAKDCPPSGITSPLLELNQNGHFFIYEFKFQN